MNIILVPSSYYHVIESKQHHHIITVSSFYRNPHHFVETPRHIIIILYHHVIMAWPSTTTKNSTGDATETKPSRELTPITLKRCHQEMKPVASRPSGWWPGWRRIQQEDVSPVAFPWEPCARLTSPSFDKKDGNIQKCNALDGNKRTV